MLLRILIGLFKVVLFDKKTLLSYLINVSLRKQKIDILVSYKVP